MASANPVRPRVSRSLQKILSVGVHRRSSLEDVWYRILWECQGNPFASIGWSAQERQDRRGGHRAINPSSIAVHQGKVYIYERAFLIHPSIGLECSHRGRIANLSAVAD